MQITQEQLTNLRNLIVELESGKYKHTTNVLHNINGYCCLGVACEMFGYNKWDESYSNMFSIYINGERSSITLPSSLIDRFGLDHNITFPDTFVVLDHRRNNVRLLSIAGVNDSYNGNHFNPVITVLYQLVTHLSHSSNRSVHIVSLFEKDFEDPTPL